MRLRNVVQRLPQLFIMKVTHTAESAHLKEPDDRRLRKWIGNGLRYIIPFVCSALLIWWLFRRIDVHDMMALIRHGVNYWWIFAMMLITALSHAVRAVRWGLQLDGVGIRATFMELCVSIFGTYALNLVVPRLGEIWRCIFIARRRKASFSTVLGTMVGDRASDAVVVLVLVGLMMLAAHPYFSAFLDRYSMGKEIVNIAEDPWLYVVIALVVGVTWSFFHFFRNFKFMDKVEGGLHRVGAGFMALFHLKQKWAFTWLTLAIWVCYFSETYVTFLAFPFTHHAFFTPEMDYGFLPGIVIFVFGSMSMAVPSNGGLGAWNIAVMFGLTLFGMTQTQGAAFAMLMWSAQAVMLVLLGVFCIIYITVTDRIMRRHQQTSEAVAGSQEKN